jgi:hypothetical protein
MPITGGNTLMTSDELKADYTDPGIINILGWDETPAEWLPGHELVYHDEYGLARCSCGQQFRYLSGWVNHERSLS